MKTEQKTWKAAIFVSVLLIALALTWSAWAGQFICEQCFQGPTGFCIPVGDHGFANCYLANVCLTVVISLDPVVVSQICGQVCENSESCSFPEAPCV